MIYEFAGHSPKIGKNTYVSDHAIVIGNVVIGENCYIGHSAIIRGHYGKIVIGNGIAVEEFVLIHVPPNDTCTIEDGVIIGHGAIVHAKRIGKNAGIGMGAILSLHSEVGDEAVIGEGTLVRRNQKIPKFAVFAGSPARKIRDLSQEDINFWADSRRLYMELAHTYIRSPMISVRREQDLPDRELMGPDIT